MSKDRFAEVLAAEGLDASDFRGLAPEELDAALGDLGLSAGQREAAKEFLSALDAHGAKDSEVKTLVKSLLQGYPVTLQTDSGELQCTMVLDRSIQRLFCWEGSNRCRVKLLHEIQLTQVQDIRTQDTKSLIGFGAFTSMGRSQTLRTAAILCDSFSVCCVFFAPAERDVFASTLATLCRQVHASAQAAGDCDSHSPANKTQRVLPSEQEASKESLFHTTPAKFVHFSEPESPREGPTGKERSFGRGNPHHGTLKRQQDALQARPWKPASIVLAA